jgi:hypothetical protein
MLQNHLIKCIKTANRKVMNTTDFRIQQMLNNTSDLIAWVQTVPSEPGKDLVNAGVLDRTTSESVFARTSGNWNVSTFLSV